MKYYCRFALFVIPLLIIFLELSRSRKQSEEVSNTPRTSRSIGNKRRSENCRLSIGSGYRGPQYTLEGTTIGTPECLVDNKFVKVSRHSLQFTKEEEVIDDWIWIDYHDRVNVLVEAPGDNDMNLNPAQYVTGGKKAEATFERKWLIFQQTKYALEGRQSLAIIGGIIESDDPSAESAAHRETREEMDVQCRSMVPLGRYRTDVNRGMGWVNSFVALDCVSVSVSDGRKGVVSTNEEVGGADQEKQELILMTTSQVMQAVQDGRFLEVQWSNTVALAMLHSAVNGNRER